MPQDEIHAAQTDQPCRPKGPCFNYGKMGHFAVQCRGGARANYMDAYEGEDQIPPLNIIPHINVMPIKAQIHMLSPQENDSLIDMMGGEQDFPQA